MIYNNGLGSSGQGIISRISEPASEESTGVSEAYLRRLKHENQSISAALKPVTDVYESDEWTRRQAVRRSYNAPSVINKQIILNLSVMLKRLGPCPVVNIAGAYKNIFKTEAGNPEILDTESMGLHGGLLGMFGLLPGYFDLFFRDEIMFVKVKEQSKDTVVTVEEIMKQAT